MKKMLFFLFAVLLVFGCVENAPEEARGKSFEGKLFFVERVIDGDTLRITGGETVRLIGINAPERKEPCYAEAREALEKMVEGKYVLLEQDVSKRDRFGRLLAYVFAGKKFVNKEMIAQGFAFAYRVEPDTRHAVEFKKAEEQARELGEGCLNGS